MEVYPREIFAAASSRSPRHSRRHPAAPCVAHHAQSYDHFASRVTTPPPSRRRTLVPDCHLHITAQSPNIACSPWHTHSAHRRAPHTNNRRTPFEPSQPTWPCRRPRESPALPATATFWPCHHTRGTASTPGPLHTATRRVARAAHDGRTHHDPTPHTWPHHHRRAEPAPPPPHAHHTGPAAYRTRHRPRRSARSPQRTAALLPPRSPPPSTPLSPPLQCALPSLSPPRSPLRSPPHSPPLSP